VQQLESHLECWKQFNRYLGQAREKKFDAEDETQFMEIKSVLTQELESIHAQLEVTTPSKEEVLNLIGQAPSVRYLSELNESALRGVENQWHKIFINWQSILGQLKVKQRDLETRGWLASLFSRK
jgi:hypothetical protein